MKNDRRNEKNNIPDRIFCTYWWIIHLKKECRTNPDLTQLTGYSKMQNQAENQSPLHCLMNKILMLNKNNWIDKSTHIEIFKKPAPATLPNKQTDRLILTLYSNDYEVPAHLVTQLPYELKKFLDEFYKAKKGEAPTDKLIPIVDKTKSKDDLFILSKHNFKSVKDLVSWCEKQVNNGESRIMVENFYRKYLTKLA